MASKRQCIAVWCGGTEIPAASNLSIKAALAQRRPALNGVFKRFYDPIALPDGRELLTLRDAAQYITELPKAQHGLALTKDMPSCLR